MTKPSPSGPSLTLIIRFSASIPDLTLPISSPQQTTSATLSTLIRPHLPSDLASCLLRYIYAGVLLQPAVALNGLLRLHKSKGPHTSPTFYIHCSISTTTKLSPAELAAEQHAAKSLTTATATLEPTARDDAVPAPSAAPEPQGFERLLSAGFTTTEVASLRSQFLAIQSHTHTPDTTPSGNELRQLEERWLDSSNPTSGASATNDDRGDGSLAGGSGGLEDMLWGNVMGFFWAVGAIVWLVREEGVWSKRRQIGVLTGVLVNVAFCVLRAGS